MDEGCDPKNSEFLDFEIGAYSTLMDCIIFSKICGGGAILCATSALRLMPPPNTFWPKVDKLQMSEANRLHLVEPTRDIA